MPASAAYAIGTSHTVCQDYARAVGERALLSDGCSGSPDTDIGARLLVCAALQDPTLDGGLPARAAQTARGWATSQGLAVPDHTPGCLDATLLLAWQDGDHLRALVSGDGAVVLRYRCGKIACHPIEHGPTPPYPIYHHQPARRARLATPPAPILFSAPVAEVDLLAVLSDGVFTFTGPHGAIPADEIAAELLAVRAPVGDFFTRRLRRFRTRTCTDRGWQHSDDLSIAGVAA
ncbi:MAG: hypothetical protein P8R54_06870 [Myxococcota bacterium]|nr:hypothetical protein [Myxococcota bacterium]